MDFLNIILEKLPEYIKILRIINSPKFRLGITGVSLINKAHLIYGIANRKANKSPSFCVVPNDAMANDLHNILVQMGLNSKVFLEKDFIFHNVAGKSSQYEYARLNTLSGILNKTIDVVIIPVKALLQRTIPKSVLKKNIFSFKKRDSFNMNDVKNILLSLGYKFTSGTVADVGQFSVRGEILDVYPINYKDPIRIDFWGDVIEEIFVFNYETQRKLKTIDSASIVPCSEILLKDKEAIIQIGGLPDGCFFAQRIKKAINPPAPIIVNEIPIPRVALPLLVVEDLDGVVLPPPLEDL